jgi:nucleotide-binding universal stress UspA family protein
MMAAPAASSVVVVGVDGSPTAAQAALWARDEALSRDIPLRLVSVAEPADPRRGADPVARAEAAVAVAADAVRRGGRPVRLETQVATGAPTLTLLEASGSAAMLVLGAHGATGDDRHRLGSTAEALVAAAGCPVAVVRGTPRSEGWVVVDLGSDGDSAAVLQWAAAEARLRRGPLRVLRSVPPEGVRLGRVELDLRPATWRRRYPDLDAQPVPGQDSVLDYVCAHPGAVQLVVTGAGNTRAVGDLLGTAGAAAMAGTDCCVLVIDAQRLV